MSALIFKIATAEDWLSGFETGAFDGTRKDKEDGFIHFSTGEQLIETLKLHYRRQVEHLLAVSAVDAEALGGALKWEPSRNGDLFPHLYAPLPRDAVRRTVISSYESLADSDFETIREFVAGTGAFDPGSEP